MKDMMFNKLTATALTLTATAATSVAIAAAPAQALVISTSIGQYDVTTVTGSWNTLQNQLRTQPWFTGDLNPATPDNDSALAVEFAGLINDDLGLPNLASFAPFFAFGTNTPITGSSTPNDVGYGVYSQFFPLGTAGLIGSSLLDTPFTWAVATPVTAIPTPALLPGLIGMGVAVLRKRKGEAATTDA